jgi:Short C-terminal domain
MTTTNPTRSRGFNLLARPPCGVTMVDDAWMAFVVDPVEQLRALADLHDRGLLSPEEFARQKTKVIER